MSGQKRMTPSFEEPCSTDEKRARLDMAEATDPGSVTSPAGLTKSGEVEKKNTLTVPELIVEAKRLFAVVLSDFRECHVLCVKSGLFSSKMISEIDTCAVSFRQMCLDTVTVARVISDQWLRSTIMFFKNISRVKEPQKMLILLGNQAKEISILFKVIGAWARDIAGRFHEAQDDTIAEAEEFKKVFAEAVKSAEEAKERADEQAEAAEKRRKAAQSFENIWQTAQIVLSCCHPLGAGAAAVVANIAASKTAEAEEFEQAANTKMRQAEDELQKKIDANKKAKVCTSTAKNKVPIQPECGCKHHHSSSTMNCEQWSNENPKALKEGFRGVRAKAMSSRSIYN